MNIENIYNSFLEKGIFNYYSEDIFKKHYGRVPLQRNLTFKYCLDYFNDYDFINIIELGTSRSLVDGKYRGCLINNIKYWEPNNLQKWDWSAGIFTKYFSDVLTYRNKNFRITTVDLSESSLNVCKIMTKNNENKINYVLSDSENFIKNTEPKSIDLLYLDTGNMDENTAQLHLREAKLVVEKNILKDDGIILIDDVRNPYMLEKKITNNSYGKSKYAIPYLLENGYNIVVDEYQVIMKKTKK